MFAKGGLKPIILASIPFVLTFLLSLIYSQLFHISFILILLPIFSLYFFRDLDRKIEDGIISPADGKIMYVDREEKKIAVFMSIFDMHVNRSPYSGEIIKNKHHCGPHHPAYKEKSEENEKNHIILSTDHGNIDILQITGIFARRIIPYVKEDDKVEKGDKIGLIRFGSRVELVLPDDSIIHVEENQKVKAGQKIGEWHD